MLKGAGLKGRVTLMKKRLFCILMLLVMTVSVLAVTAEPAQAASKTASGTTLAAPKITVTVSEELESAQIKIAKTKNADGYRIYVSEPDNQPFRKIASVKKNGKKVRKYTYTEHKVGTYKIKVKAYATVNGKKITSAYSETVKFDLAPNFLKKFPVGIRFVGDPKTEFRLGGKGKGETDKKPYNFEYEVDEEYKDAYVVPRTLAEDGTEAYGACFGVTDKGGIYANRMGEAYLALFAFERQEDAYDINNAVAVSEKIKLRSVNEEGKTGLEPIKYADITFKKGFAYFGEAASELVKDTTLANKIVKEGDYDGYGHIVYKDVEYSYDAQDKKGPFRTVPIEWRILEKTDEYALLMTNSILDGGGYDGFDDRKTTQWKTSCMYYGLNSQNGYPKKEKSYTTDTRMNDRVLMEMKIGGVKCKRAIPTIEVLTNEKYGFSTSWDADKNRIVEPSDHYDQCTNHRATRNGFSIYGPYWVVNEKTGQTVIVDTTGKIWEGKLDCNVYEIGCVQMIKVDLTLCNVYEE